MEFQIYIYLVQWLWLKGGMAFMILEGMEEYVNLSGSITYLLKNSHDIIVHVNCPHLSYYILDFLSFWKQIPVILGMLGVWYNNFFGAQTHGLFPYDQVSTCYH